MQLHGHQLNLKFFFFIGSSSKSSSSQSSSLISSQFSQLQREKFEKEVEETLEMSRLIWDEDPFVDQETSGADEVTSGDFDDDSFWENYDFESALN